nr:heavy metal translocating P-type ATPase [Treponema sp.]
MEQYNISGMSCAACQARIEKAVSSLEGVKTCAVSLLTNSMGVEGTASSEEIIRAVEKAGYGASIKSSKSASASQQKNDGDQALEDRESPVILKRLIASLVFLLPLLYVSMGHMLWDWPLPSFLKGNHVAMGLYQLVLSALVMVINQKFFISGFRAIFHRAPNMDSLVALGATASFLYSLFALFAMTSAVLLQDEEKVLYYMKQFYFESAAMILTLITVGKLLEAKSKGKTTSALKALMKLSPKTAVLLIDGQEKEVPVEQVKPGDIFLVRPGDSIPVDGIVVKGESAVNESALTGESIPVEKETGSEVSAATINTWGYMECRASRVGQDTTLSAIIRMVSDAAATKAPIAKIADKVSGLFVPLVILIALVTFAAWLFAGQSVGYAIARAVSVLVISCPCALGLATPVAIMVGSGLAARNGILFKTAASLEQAGKSKIIALDKTGTITSGVMKVTDIISFDEDLLSLAYALEVKSEHPVSRAIVEYAESQKLELCETSDFEVLSGKGLKARLADKKGNITSFGISGGQEDGHESGLKGAYEETLEEGQGGQKSASEVDQKLAGKSMFSEDELAGGNQAFISSLQIALSQENKEELSKLSSEGKTPVLFAKGNKLLGIIALADTIKEDSKKAVSELKSMGLHTVMLTGDNQLTAQAIGKQAGIDEIIADVKPDQKEEHIKRLMEKGKVTMVGDGIND